MKSDNELIEVFYVSQGGKPSLPADIDFYSSDWNMLMPVVEKIGNVWEPEYPMVSECAKVLRLTIGSHIQTVYGRVVEFVKWYNEYKKP